MNYLRIRTYKLNKVNDHEIDEKETAKKKQVQLLKTYNLVQEDRCLYHFYFKQIACFEVCLKTCLKACLKACN